MFRDAPRYQSMGNPRYRNGTDFTLHPDKFDDPFSWSKSRYVFVNSMSDLFHPEMPEEALQKLFRVMNQADEHVFQLLTKRGSRLAGIGPSLPWADHIWAGVSVGHAETYGGDGDRPTDRIEELRRCGASVCWISAEPLIGPLPNLNLAGIDWVVIGGESAPKRQAREMKLGWVRDIIAQCRLQDTAVFVKQMGSVWARENGCATNSDGKYPKAGDPSEWPEDLRIREQPDIFDGQPELR